MFQWLRFWAKVPQDPEPLILPTIYHHTLTARVLVDGAEIAVTRNARDIPFRRSIFHVYSRKDLENDLTKYLNKYGVNDGDTWYPPHAIKQVIMEQYTKEEVVWENE